MNEVERVNNDFVVEIQNEDESEDDDMEFDVGSSDE